MTRIHKGVITAAGRGTRQYPASQTVQKELFPMVDVDGYAKPTLQLIVEELLASGVEEICVIVNPANAEPIRRHFQGLTASELSGQFAGKAWAEPLSDALHDMARRLTFVTQETQNGFGHAVFQARDWVGDEPFVMMVGDHIYFSQTERRCARQIMDVSESHNTPVSSVARIPEAHLNRYGTIAGTRLPGTNLPVYTIREMTEKPAVDYARAHLRTPGLPDDQYLCFFGIHAFSPAIFDYLDYLIQHDLRQRGEIQLTSAQELLLKREPYLACEIAGVSYDMGIPEGLVQTQIALALRSPFAAPARVMLEQTRGTATDGVQ